MEKREEGMPRDNDDNDDNIESYKVILIGDSSVGKTAIINRFSENEFNDNHIYTIGVDFRFKSIDVDGTPVKLQIWDTAGQERFRAIGRSYYRGAHGIIIVYAVNDAKSFQSVRNWLTEIDIANNNNNNNNNNSDSNDSDDTNSDESTEQQYQQPPVIKYLVGNKTDLMDTRVISETEGINEANAFGIKFMETSAKTSLNIEELFVSVAREIRSAHQACNLSEPSVVATPNVELTDDNTKTEAGGGCC